MNSISRSTRYNITASEANEPSSPVVNRSKLCDSCQRITIDGLRVGFNAGSVQDVTERAKQCQLCALVVLRDQYKQWSEGRYELFRNHNVVLRDGEGDLSALTVNVQQSK